MYLTYLLGQKSGESRMVFGPFRDRFQREDFLDFLDSKTILCPDANVKVQMCFVSSVPKGFVHVQPEAFPELMELMQPY